MAKVNISTANRHKKAKFDVSSTHITTLDVGQLRPTYVLPMYAGENISLNYNQFSRLSPLVAPTFGSFLLKSFAFFVPHRLVFKQYDAFRSGSSDATEYATPPTIFNSQIVACLQNYSLGALTLRGSSFVPMYIAFSPNSERYYLARGLSSGSMDEVICVDFTYGDGVASLSKNGFLNFEDALYALSYLQGLSDGSNIGTENNGVFYADIKSDQTFNNYSFGKQDYFVPIAKNVRMTGGTPSSVTVDLYQPCQFTAQGRWLYNIFLSLGYGVSFVGFNNYFFERPVDTEFNLLPLLEFCRVLYDYVYPSQWVQQQGFSSMFENGEDVLEDKLQRLVDLLLVSYDKDFYTQLWTDFNSPAPGLRQVSSNVPGVNDDLSSADALGVVSSKQDATTLTSNGSALENLSAQGLRLLQSISDYITRRNVGGSRFREWMKSHFGFVTAEQRSHYSTYLKSWSDEIKIADVTNTSVSDGAVLGEQAGKGYGSSQGSLKFTADEDGMFIVLSMVIPIVGYFQGAKPWTQALKNPEDLYLPEFDSMGNQPVRMDELFADFKTPADLLGALNSGYLPNGIFGFAPRYSEYKHGFDYLTGDFRLPSRNVGMDAYHTMRVLPTPSRQNPLVLDAEFLRVSNQYNRIFAQDPTDESGASQYDKIFTIFQFDVTAYRHMLTISESIPLFDKQGRDVTVSMNGSSL